MFGLFFRKKEVEQLKQDTKEGFDSVKKDINGVTEWIKHLNSEKERQEKELEDIKIILSSLKEDIEGLKNVFSIIEESKKKQLFKTAVQKIDKQTAVYAVQTGVETAVQTPNFDNFSITERAIIWTLLNTDMNLSYDDIAAILGKEKSTIRGQINRIKQKSEGLIREIIEKNGKKRMYIPEKIKEKLQKTLKVRVKKKKKTKNE